MFSILSKKTGISLLVTATFVLLIVAVIFGQAARQPNEGMWNAIEESSLDQNSKRLIVPSIYRTVRLDQDALMQALASAPMEFTQDVSRNPIIYLPMPDGTLARFRFEKSPVIEPGLAAQYPGLDQTYRAHAKVFSTVAQAAPPDAANHHIFLSNNSVSSITALAS